MTPSGATVGFRPETLTSLFEGQPAPDREAMATVEEVVYYGDMTYYDVKLDGTDEVTPAVDAQRLWPSGAGHRDADPGGLEPRGAGAVPLGRTLSGVSAGAAGLTSSGGQAGQAEAAQIDADTGLQQILGAVGRFGAGRTAHESSTTPWHIAQTWAENIVDGGRLPGRHVLAKFLGGGFQHRPGLLRHHGQIGMRVQAEAAFEHRHVMAGIFAGKGEVGAAGRLERGKGGRLAVVVGEFHQGGEDVIALPGHFGDQFVAAGEMAVDGGGRDIGGLGGLGQGEARRALFLAIRVSAASTSA